MAAKLVINAIISFTTCDLLILKNLLSLFSQDIEFVQVQSLLFIVEMQIIAIILIIIACHEVVDLVVEEILVGIETLHPLIVQEQVVGQLVERLMDLGLVLDQSAEKALVEIIPMFVLGRETGYVPILCKCQSF